jgi:hypothetical protein
MTIITAIAPTATKATLEWGLEFAYKIALFLGSLITISKEVKNFIDWTKECSSDASPAENIPKYLEYLKAKGISMSETLENLKANWSEVQEQRNLDDQKRRARCCCKFFGYNIPPEVAEQRATEDDIYKRFFKALSEAVMTKQVDALNHKKCN